MSTIIISLGLLIILSGGLYIAAQKKNLSDNILLDFEKNIKPKVLRFYYISVLPMLAFSIYITSGHFKGFFVLIFSTGFATIALNILGYSQIKQTVEKSLYPSETKYIQHLFVFSCLGELVLLAGVASSFRLF